MQDRQGRRARARRTARRDLVPELWVPSLDDRALRERLRRRMHLVRMRALAMNRIFGLQAEWRFRIPLQRLRALDGMTLLEAQGMPAVWRRSIPRGARGDRPARRAYYPARSGSAPARARRRACRVAGHDPRRRRLTRAH